MNHQLVHQNFFVVQKIVILIVESYVIHEKSGVVKPIIRKTCVMAVVNTHIVGKISVIVCYVEPQKNGTCNPRVRVQDSDCSICSRVDFLDDYVPSGYVPHDVWVVCENFPLVTNFHGVATISILVSLMVDS